VAQDGREGAVGLDLDVVLGMNGEDGLEMGKYVGVEFEL
jgi:hypothetical protein